MQYLGFVVGGEHFCIDVGLVLEILDQPDFSRLPANPPFVCGMVNLRGKIVSLFDLHARFGMAWDERTSSVIVIESSVYDTGLLGLVVDHPEEVFESSEIEEIASYSDAIPQSCVSGVIQREGRTYVALNTDAVIGPGEFQTEG